MPTAERHYMECTDAPIEAEGCSSQAKQSQGHERMLELEK